MQTKPIAVSAPCLDLIFEQRHTSSAHRALELVGRRVIPTATSERAQRARGLPRAGVVTGVCIPDLAHAYVIVAFGTDVELMFPHDLNLLPKTPTAAWVDYASSNPISHGETPLSDGPAHPAAPDLRPHLEWALRRIEASLNTDARHQAAQWALVAAIAAPGGGPDLRPHLRLALRRIANSLDTGDRYDAALAALDAADAAAGGRDA